MPCIWATKTQIVATNVLLCELLTWKIARSGNHGRQARPQSMHGMR